MSYTAAIRTHLVTASIEVPGHILAYLNAVDEVCAVAMDVVLSADSVGCSEEMTVVNGTKLQQLSTELYGLIDSDVEPGKSNFSGSDELNGVVEVIMSIDTENGLDDPNFGSATKASTGERVLIHTDALGQAPATHFDITYPRESKYGIPEEASRRGAANFARLLDLVPTDLTVNACDAGDDSGDAIKITVQLPAAAVVEHGLDDVREFAGLHWNKHFDTLLPVDKKELVNRYIEAITGFSL